MDTTRRVSALALALTLSLVPIMGANARSEFGPRPDLHWPACHGVSQCVQATHMMRAEPQYYDPPAGPNTFDTPDGAFVVNVRPGEATRGVVETLLGVRHTVSRHHVSRTPSHRHIATMAPAQVHSTNQPTAVVNEARVRAVTVLANQNEHQIANLTAANTDLAHAAVRHESEIRALAQKVSAFRDQVGRLESRVTALTSGESVLKTRVSRLEEVRLDSLTPGMLWEHFASSTRAIAAFVLAMVVIAFLGFVLFAFGFTKSRTRHPSILTIQPPPPDLSEDEMERWTANVRSMYVGKQVECPIAAAHVRPGHSATFCAEVVGAKPLTREGLAARFASLNPKGKQTVVLLARLPWDGKDNDPIEIAEVSWDGHITFHERSISRILGRAHSSRDMTIRGKAIREWMSDNHVVIKDDYGLIVDRTRMKIVVPSNDKPQSCGLAQVAIS